MKMLVWALFYLIVTVIASWFAFLHYVITLLSLMLLGMGLFSSWELCVSQVNSWFKQMLVLKEFLSSINYSRLNCSFKSMTKGLSDHALVCEASGVSAKSSTCVSEKSPLSYVLERGSVIQKLCLLLK